MNPSRPDHDQKLRLTRRALFGRTTTGLGSLALASLLNPNLLRAADTSSGAASPLHFAPKARRIIYLYMAGGPSHLETLDYKPKLAAMQGQPMPGSYTAGMPIAQPAIADRKSVV